jgi:MFS family permease
VGALLSTAYHSVGSITSEVYSWRNIFFINGPSAILFSVIKPLKSDSLVGLISMGVAILAYFIIPSSVESTSMFSEREREYLLARNKVATAGRSTAEATQWNLVFQGFKSAPTWVGM